MKKRPLCILCLTFLMINGLIMLITGGQSYLKVPASSIFYGMEQSKEVLIQGQVYKKEHTSKYQTLYLKNNSISFHDKSYYESQILVYDDTFEEVKIGETVYLRGKLELFETARNPGNFDQRTYYARKGIRGFGWSMEIICITGKAHIIKEKLYQWRQEWKDLLLENMSEEHGGILSAILLSEKSEMEESTKELYQKNGIGHILAISGLHISFIGLGIYRIFRKAGCSYGLSGILSCIVLTGYVWMIGDSVSVIRAYIMLLLRIGADVCGRIYDMLTALIFSAAVTILNQPLYLMDAGFYLSYGAIIGILLIRPQLEKIVPSNLRVLKRFLPGIAINLALYPVLLWFYYEVPTYSLLLNLIVIPLMSWVMGLGVFGSLLCGISSSFGKILLLPVEMILKLYGILSEIGSKLPLSSIVFGKPSGWKIVIYYIILVLIVYYLHLCKTELLLKKIKWYVIGIFIGLTLLFVKLPNGRLHITMVDVGQGDCIFIEGPYGKKYLIDGGSSDVSEVGKYRIEPYLKSQGAGTLDYVFVSHGDSDHFSGIQEMIERQEIGVKIKNMVLPVNYKNDKELIELAHLALVKGINVTVIEQGQSLLEGRLKITCVQPGYEEQFLEGNAGSMVLDISFGSFDMLCTGDVENEGEDVLIQNMKGKDYDVLKVAHHGSKYSTQESFLQVTKPEVSLISSGEDNSYGHPHRETIERLRKAGSRIFQTAQQGAITLETDGDFIDIFSPSI